MSDPDDATSQLFQLLRAHLSRSKLRLSVDGDDTVLLRKYPPRKDGSRGVLIKAFGEGAEGVHFDLIIDGTKLVLLGADERVVDPARKHERHFLRAAVDFEDLEQLGALGKRIAGPLAGALADGASVADGVALRDDRILVPRAEEAVAGLASAEFKSRSKGTVVDAGAVAPGWRALGGEEFLQSGAKFGLVVARHLRVLVISHIAFLFPGVRAAFMVPRESFIRYLMELLACSSEFRAAGLPVPALEASDVELERMVSEHVRQMTLLPEALIQQGVLARAELVTPRTLRSPAGVLIPQEALAAVAR